jgi:hypothetical protein
MEQTSAPDQPTADAAPAAEESLSLADHAAAFPTKGEKPSAAAERETPEPIAAPAAAPAPPSADRDETGKFAKRGAKPAKPAQDDARVEALERRLKEAEDRLSARTEPAAERREEPTARPAASGPKFQTFEEFVKTKGNESADWDDYYDERARWNYSQVRESERQQEAASADEKAFLDLQKSHSEAVPAVAKKYPDFYDRVAPGGKPLGTSLVVAHACLAVGPEADYYLATHPEEFAALTNDTLVERSNPAFKATVAATRRYLAALVADQRPARAPMALVPPQIAKPPSPLRTAPARDRDADTPPEDNASLADHERFFNRKRKRA